MKVVAAFLLAVLGGNANPSADNIKDIIGAGNFVFVCSLLVKVSNFSVLLGTPT